MEALIFIGSVIFVLLAIAFLPGDVMLLVARPGNWLLRKAGLQEKPVVTNNINDPLARLVGTTVIVTRPFKDGRGRIIAGPSEWVAESQDLISQYQSGESVRVTAAKQGIVVVEAIDGKAHNN